MFACFGVRMFIWKINSLQQKDTTETRPNEERRRAACASSTLRLAL
jgi:hypothetical protein